MFMDFATGPGGTMTVPITDQVICWMYYPELPENFQGGSKELIEKTVLLKMMFDIQEEIKLSMEYETDARDVWPKRWETLFTQIRDLPEVEG